MTSCASMHCQVRMDGSPEAVRALRNLIDSFLRDHGEEEQVVRAVVLAFSEALDNAVEHGMVDAGDLQVRLRYTRRFILLSLRDSGADRAPTGAVVEPHGDSERGRGLLLMRKLMDYVRLRSYPTGGTRVTLMRRLDREA